LKMHANNIWDLSYLQIPQFEGAGQETSRGIRGESAFPQIWLRIRRRITMDQGSFAASIFDNARAKSTSGSNFAQETQEVGGRDRRSSIYDRQDFGFWTGAHRSGSSGEEESKSRKVLCDAIILLSHGFAR